MYYNEIFWIIVQQINEQWVKHNFEYIIQELHDIGAFKKETISRK